MKKQVTPGETPAQITVSMIDQDLKDGVSKSEMAVKYGIKPWEVDEMFKHPFLKGRRPSRKKALSFSFVDDVSEEIPGFEGTKEQFHFINWPAFSVCVCQRFFFFSRRLSISMIFD